MVEIANPKPVRKCPICGKRSSDANYPFCSVRCQDIDLNRWLSDAYRIPTKEEPESLPDADMADDD